jgi:hypothetical protein
VGESAPQEVRAELLLATVGARHLRAWSMAAHITVGSALIQAHAFCSSDFGDISSTFGAHFYLSILMRSRDPDAQRDEE